MQSGRSLEHLLSPGRIGSLAVRNRIVMSPMGSNLAERDGRVDERIVRYYEERAKGGVGLAIVGVGAVSFPAGACNPNQVAISDDAFLPGLTELTRRVHAHGARIAIQLQHAGKVAVRDMVAGRPMWVPSVPSPKRSDLTRDLTAEEMQRFIGDLSQPGARIAFHEMTVGDIEAMVSAFAEAAARARRAGFDGVELHAGHGYLLSSFLSPASNLRSDAYGGSHENRARFLVEAIRAAKQRAGSDFPVWCRLDGAEFGVSGGISLADAERTAESAEAAGADAIHVSAYADPTSGVAFTEAPLVHRPGGFVELARAVKQRVGVPVIAVGRIEPEVGDALIADGGADFIAMARKLLADPELPRKLSERRARDVRPCIYCYTCVGNIFLNGPTCCAVNPANGREAEFPLEPARTPKRVLVVGGGPAGMEAARVAALRGHEVTLCERSSRLGGALRVAALVAPENGALARWLEEQVRALPVAVHLDCEVTPERIAEWAPEVLVVAAGAGCTPSPIPGADRPDVRTGAEVQAALAGEAAAGAGLPAAQRVTVVGGGVIGVKFADLLSAEGREVTLLESDATLAAQMAPPLRWRTLHRLRERGAALRSGVAVASIDDRGVHLVDADGAAHCVPTDFTILAGGASGRPEFVEALARVAPTVHAVGDCTGMGFIRGAMEDAGRVARAI